MEKLFITPAFGTTGIPVLFAAPGGTPRGVVQIAHGMCEYKERYAPLMEFLAGKGYAAVCSDHIGHGEAVASEEDLGFMGRGGWLGMVENARAVTLWAKERWPGVPLTLFGHSMGSMVVRSYAKRYDECIDSLIVCGSPSDNPVKMAGLLLSRFFRVVKGDHFRPVLLQKLSFGSFNKPFAKEGWPAAWVCSDPEILKSYHSDPLCRYIFTADGFENLLLLMRDCYAKSGWHLANPSLPVNFISGGEDPCRISDKALSRAVEAMRSAGYRDVSLKVYPGMRHEIHNEKGYMAVWEDILGFLA